MFLDALAEALQAGKGFGTPCSQTNRNAIISGEHKIELESRSQDGTLGIISSGVRRRKNF
jgi:hypothetical protein